MSATNHPRPVLIVDDDETIIEFISLALSDEGYECVGAENGEVATQRVIDSDPALILLDLSMPKMNGAEFCRWLHSNGHQGIPIIVMTAGEHAAQQCAELGAQDYLAKPFELSMLRSRVEQWVKVWAGG